MPAGAQRPLREYQLSSLLSSHVTQHNLYRRRMTAQSGFGMPAMARTHRRSMIATVISSARWPFHTTQRGLCRRHTTARSRYGTRATACACRHLILAITTPLTGWPSQIARESSFWRRVMGVSKPGTSRRIALAAGSGPCRVAASTGHPCPDTRTGGQGIPITQIRDHYTKLQSGPCIIPPSMRPPILPYQLQTSGDLVV
jgi:hypothetical protein